MENLDTRYHHGRPGPSWSNVILWDALKSVLAREAKPGTRIFEVGCGNGATAALLAGLGYAVTGVDPSPSGIALGRQAAPSATLAIGSAYDNLAANYGQFSVVISLEVVEHCFWPRRFAATVFDLTEPGGLALISTPYHGYLKNLALALAGKFDEHWSPLWDGGHIKFWSMKTLGQLLTETGFAAPRFVRVGRVAKSMIALCRKP